MRSVLAGGGTTAPTNTVAGPGRTPRAGGRGRGIIGGGGDRSDVFYLWVLLGLEVTAMWVLRGWSSNHHGG